MFSIDLAPSKEEASVLIQLHRSFGVTVWVVTFTRLRPGNRQGLNRAYHFFDLPPKAATGHLVPFNYRVKKGSSRTVLARLHDVDVSELGMRWAGEAAS